MPMHPTSKNFWSKLAGFRSNVRGTISVIFSLSLVPILGLVGVAVDYSSVSKSRSSLQAIADSAAVGAVSDVVVKPTIPWPEQRELSISAAKRDFDGLIAGLKQQSILKTSSIDATIANNIITVKICYSGSQPTVAMAIAGQTSIDFSGCSEASSAPPLYVSVYVLADASGSMGVGSTVADQDLMIAKLGCAFACHTLNWKTAEENPKCENRGSWNDGSKTTDCAHKIGAKTRFDVVKSALGDVVDDAKGMAKVPEQFSFAVYKFSTGLTKVQGVSTNLTTVKSAISAMEPDVKGGGSNMRRAFSELTQAIPASGDGKTAANPKVFILLMTDGVEGNVDEYQRCTTKNGKSYCRYFGDWNQASPFTVNTTGFWWGIERSQAIDAAMCDAVKAKGAVVATLNTEYFVSEKAAKGDTRFSSIKTMLQPKIRETMQKCATRPDLAYFATTPGEIQQATNAMFRSLMEKARIIE